MHWFVFTRFYDGKRVRKMDKTRKREETETETETEGHKKQSTGIYIYPYIPRQPDGATEYFTCEIVLIRS